MLNRNNFGQLYYCRTCKTYHLLFQNFHFILNQKQKSTLHKYIEEVDIAYWDEKYCDTPIKRKIPVPTCQENLLLIFDKQEFSALKELFSMDRTINKMLSINDIEYSYILN